MPVTVRFDTVAPPKSVTVAVATDPRFVTERSVSVLLAQLVPFARQTAWPCTKRFEPEAVLKPNHEVEVPLVKEREEPKSVVAVAAVAVRVPSVEAPETLSVV